MPTANIVDKKIRLDLLDIVRFQLLSYSFMNNVSFSNAELECLALLAISGESDLSEFCNITVDYNVFKVSQTARNFLTKMEREGIVIKKGKSRKTVSISDNLQIQTQGNIVLNYKIFYVDTQES